MPSEIRHVVFRNVEVARAVRSYFERTGKAMPQGELLDCTIETDGPGHEVRFSMSISSIGGHGQSTNVTADGAQLAAALILYCRGEHIPLPSAAAKSLAVFGESLCLVVTHNPKGISMPKVSR